MKKYCLVRFDDLCPTMDEKQFDRAFALMEKYGIKPLLGVIPDNRDPDQIKNEPDPDFWAKIKEFQKRGWAIAMHGYTHVYDRIAPKTLLRGRARSEFAGNDYESQSEKIRKGKQILLTHGVETDIFFVPAHTFDKITLRALYDNGFRYISDGLSKKPYMREGIKCVPCRSFGVPKDKKSGILVAVNHPSEWERVDKACDYDRLTRFCENNKNDFVSFDELKNMACGNFFIQNVSEKLYRIETVIKEKIKKIVGRKQ